MRPGPDQGYAACEAAVEGLPERRQRRRRHAAPRSARFAGASTPVPAGIGYAAIRTGAGQTVAALAVVNASGDVLEADGSLLGGPHDDDGSMVRSIDILAAASGPPAGAGVPTANGRRSSA